MTANRNVCVINGHAMSSKKIPAEVMGESPPPVLITSLVGVCLCDGGPIGDIDHTGSVGKNADDVQGGRV